MRHQESPLFEEQLGLFHRQSLRPRWSDLPEATREELRPLLIKLLSEGFVSRHNRETPRPRQEVSDE